MGSIFDVVAGSSQSGWRGAAASWSVVVSADTAHDGQMSASPSSNPSSPTVRRIFARSRAVAGFLRLGCRVARSVLSYDSPETRLV
jgi:hypothetical protein